jgi:hypothetical protein
MKKLLLSFVVFSTCALHAQDKIQINTVNFSVGKNATKFLYQFGSETKPTQFVNGNAYSLNIGIDLSEKHTLRPELNFYQAGAKTTVDDIPLNWKLSYLGVGFGYLYNLLNKNNISLSPGAVVGVDYMTQGEQTIGINRYDIIESNYLKKLNVSAGLLLNSRFKVTETLFLSFEYRFNFGLNQIEIDSEEKTRNIGNVGLIGLSFKL